MPRAKRICGKPSCPNAADGRYCKDHNAEYEAKRGTPEQRNGKDHKKIRARVNKVVQAGRATCHLCGGWIQPGTPWHLDHTEDRTGYRGPAHAFCNMSDGGKRSHRI